MSAPKAKRRQEVAVSECSRPGRSRQEVCERRASPAPAKTKKLQLNAGAFLILNNMSHKHTQDSKSKERAKGEKATGSARKRLRPAQKEQTGSLRAEGESCPS